MGLLYQSRKEHKLTVDYFAEAAKLLGQEALLFQVDKKKFDLHNDRDIVYKEPIRVNFLLDENPKPVLKKMGWFTEEEDLPYVGYFVVRAEDMTDIDLGTDTKIRLTTRQEDKTYLDDEDEIHNEFLISAIRGNKLVPTYFTCKLVPYRPKAPRRDVVDPVTTNNTSTGYSFVQRKNKDKV